MSEQTYRLTVDGTDYELPWAGTVAGEVPFEVTERMINDPESKTAQLAVGFASLVLAAPPELMAKIRKMGTASALELIGPWMNWAPEGEEPAGESSGSEG